MRPHSTPAILIALAVALALALILGTSARKRPAPVAEIGEPAMVTPVPAPTVRPLTLALTLPELTPDQRYWFHVAQVVPLCPLCAGVDQPPVPLSDNALIVFLALVWTESRYQPWETSSAGCYGLGQLCGDLRTADTDANPALNLYMAAREWARLVAQRGGDYSGALMDYKGITTPDTMWQAESVWAMVRITG